MEVGWLQIKILIFVAYYFLLVSTKEFLSLISTYDGDYCVTNSSSAMYYVNNKEVITLESRHIPTLDYFCEFDKNRNINCLNDFKNDNWEVVNSLGYENLPIFDERWEGLEIKNVYHTKNVKSKTLLYISTIQKLEYENFEIVLSVRSTEAHFLLCDTEDIAKASCYWFIIQGWGGNRTSLRKCSNQIPIEDRKYPDPPCETEIVTSYHNADYPLFLFMEVWSHIFIRKNESTLYLGQIINGERKIILKYLDTDYSISPKYLLGHTKNQIGYYKLHATDYLRTSKVGGSTFDIGNIYDVTNKQICLSFFFTSCAGCLTSISFFTSDRSNNLKEKIFEKTISSSYGYWRREKIIVNDVPRTTYLRTRIIRALKDTSNDENIFWAFDNVRNCHSEEYRVTPKESNKIQTCNLVPIEKKILRQEDTKYIPEEICTSRDRLGKSCISCEILEDNKIIDSCKKIKICENEDDQNRCFCSPGYLGKECQKECQLGTFGYGCQHECGNCVSEKQCSVENGKCLCDYRFGEPTCHWPKNDLIVKYPSTVLSSSAKACTIELNLTNYLGEGFPNFVLVQYQKLTTSKPEKTKWKDYKEIDQINGTFELKNLDSSSIYALRLLISVEKGNLKNLQYTKIPYAICNTTCNGMNEEDIEIKPSNTSFKIKLKLSEDKCLPNAYQWFLLDEYNETVLNKPLNENRDIGGLMPVTFYQIHFIGPNKIMKKFKTLEGVPSDIRNIKGMKSTSDSISLSWQEPEHSNGNIEYYRVLYKRVQEKSCGEAVQENESEQNTTNLYIELMKLKPFSVYEIEIIAVNKLYQSGKSGRRLETMGIDYFDEDEKLEEGMPSLSIYETTINLKISNIQCANVKGKLTISIRYECIDEWCLAKNRSDYDFTKTSSYSLRNLSPFTRYNITIFFCRSNICISGWKTSIKTKASTPNPIKDFLITSKGKGYFSMRWIPPFPPTGTLIYYKIVTSCSSCYIQHRYEHIIQPENCSIWPDYHCARIENLYKNERYSIEMQAANSENYKYVEVNTKVNIYVNESAPDPPYALKTKWYVNNTMELSWNHPNRSNGDLKRFEIQIFYRNGSRLKSLPIENKYRLVYSILYTKPFPPATDLEIEVCGVNVGKGQLATIYEHSFPLVPKLANSSIIISNFTEKTITINVNLQRKDNNSIYVAQYLFILINDSSANTTKDKNIEKLEKGLQKNLDVDSHFKVIKEINLNEIKNNTFEYKIGDESVQSDNVFLNGALFNKPLLEGHIYNITILFLNTFKKKWSYKFYSIQFSTEGKPKISPKPPSDNNAMGENSSGGNFFYFFLILLLLVPIAIGIMYKKKILKIRPTISLERILDGTSRQQSNGNDDVIILDDKESIRIVPKSSVKVKSKSTIKTSTNPPNSSEKNYSKITKIADFEEYVKTSIQNGELERQHALFPRGLIQPSEYGAIKINKRKNRYNNLIAYDHSRVKLEKINGDEYSDYINASYINGFNTPRAYIATQGPKATTLYDFWRMIWQENVEHIIMVANIIEGGKKKVEQYWPNINEELEFEDIHIQYQSMELFADYEYRVFHVSRGNITRKVEQLHFTSWPDHGVPLYPQSLVPFIRKILKIALSSASPVVVHCSAGVGRTGTILLADICLRMTAKEGVVDLLNNLQQLREQRPNMVDNVEQYKLAHLVVLECLMGLNTSIPCNDNMDKIVEKLIKGDEYKVQMEYLIETEWQDHAMKTVAETRQKFDNYPEKNRDQEIVPENLGRIFLPRYPNDNESSSYINAVQVDGFRCPGQFIVTQQPLPNTVGDFWRLVVEKQIRVIVCLNEINLNEKSSCKFWPNAEEPELQPVDYILITFAKMVTLEYFDIYSVNVWIKRKEKEKMDVEIVTFKGWPVKNLLPSNCEEFLAFWEETSVISRSNHVIVTCFDGALASGVYVALSFIIEKMKLEQECDVCLAVRTVRHNRRYFVTNQNQFVFLYEAAVKYINGFQSYANFQNK